MTATEGRIKPQSISDDIAAIEAVLAEFHDLEGSVSQTLLRSILCDGANPARLRRVLDTMQAMGEALVMAHKELSSLPKSLGYEFTHMPDIAAALALYEGKQ